MTVKLFGVFLVATIGFYDEGQAASPTIISRQGWGARAPRSKTNLPQNPPPYIVIHHSEAPPACSTEQTCKQAMRSIQNFHMDSRQWSDIGYNFLIGGDGNVYEGRGWGIQGAHHPKYNSRSIGICLIGNFQSVLPPAIQMEALNNLINFAVENNKVKSNYHLIGHRQGRATTCPGDALFNEVKRMPHWDPNPN